MLSCAIFVGSIRKDSFNKRLALGLEKISSDLFIFNYVDISHFPLFSQDIENPVPPVVQAAKNILAQSPAVLFITPEYNRSIPGVLKNAIDWCSRPWGHNSFQGKAAGMMGLSVGNIGTAMAQAHLKSILPMLGLAVMGGSEVFISGKNDYFTDGGEIAEEKNRAFLRAYMEQFAQWTAKIQA